MGELVKVWLLRPHESCAGPVRLGLERAEIGALEVGSLAEIVEAIDRGTNGGEAIVLPPRLDSGETIVQAALNIKAHELCHSFPLIFLRGDRDGAAVGTLLGAGVDLILNYLTEGDVLAGNVQSLVRYRRALAEREANLAKSGGLRRSVLDVLQSVREGIVLVNRERAILFLNSAARRLLEVDSLVEAPFPAALENQFFELVAAHERLSLHHPHEDSDNLVRSTDQRTIQRLDGRMVRVSVDATTIRGAQGEDIGTGFALTDLNELAHMEHARAQARRQRFLALLSSATAVKAFPEAAANLGGPVAYFDAVLEAEPLSADAHATLAHLIEIVDHGLSPGVRIKISGDLPRPVKCKPGHLFQILGEVLLAAVDASGAPGEVRLEQRASAGIATFTITAAVSRELTAPGSDPLARLIRGVPSGEGEGESTQSMVPAGAQFLPTASRLVSACEGSVVHRSDHRTFHVEVLLPCL